VHRDWHHHGRTRWSEEAVQRWRDGFEQEAIPVGALAAGLEEARRRGMDFPPVSAFAVARLGGWMPQSERAERAARAVVINAGSEPGSGAHLDPDALAWLLGDDHHQVVDARDREAMERNFSALDEARPSVADVSVAPVDVAMHHLQSIRASLGIVAQ
jgi:hypothetical protein